MLDFALCCASFIALWKETNGWFLIRGPQAKVTGWTTAADLFASVLTYLHTQPITSSFERVVVKAPATVRRRPLPGRKLASCAPIFYRPGSFGGAGAITSVIGDEYYAILPQGTERGSSE